MAGKSRIGSPWIPRNAQPILAMTRASNVTTSEPNVVRLDVKSRDKLGTVKGRGKTEQKKEAPSDLC